MLVVIAIMGILAALLLPVFFQAKSGSHKANCLSSLRQPGMGLSMYMGDHEDKSPVSVPPFFRGTPLGLGWAGAIYPYVKSTAAFRCPGDATHVPPVVGGRTPRVVSYAINTNLSRIRAMSEVARPANSVQLFEVTGNSADILLPDEGASKGPTVTGQFSAMGDGTYGGILATTTIWTGPGQGRFTRYVTGEIDNAGSPEQGHGDDYEGETARHGEGANWLAMDTHVVWLAPKSVSAGLSPKSADDLQRSRGCGYLNPTITEFACAEGSAVGKHRLTFSLR
ncbi:hypothetical protein BH11ARM2_BH11ARM2_06540 [soil metagenome]